MNLDFWLDLFKKLAIGITILVVVLIGGITWSVYNPGQAWRLFVRGAVLGRQVTESYTSADWKVKRNKGLSWRFEWVVSDYRLEKTAPQLLLTGDLRATGTIQLFNPVIKVEVEALNFSMPKPGHYEFSQDGSRDDFNPFDLIRKAHKQMKRFASAVTLNKVDIQVPEFKMLSGKAPPELLSVKAIKPGAKDPQSLDVQIGVKGETRELNSMSQIRFDLVDSDQEFAKVRLETAAKDQKASMDVTLAFPADRLTVKGGLTGQWGSGARPLAVSSTLDAEVLDNQIRASGKADVNNLRAGIGDIKGAIWNLDLPLWKGVVMDHLSGQLSINANVPIGLITPELKAQLEKSCSCTWPPHFVVSLTGKVWPAHLIYSNAAEKPIATFDFAVTPIVNRLLELNLKGEYRVSKTPDGELQHSPALKGGLKLPNFQSVKGLLEANKIMVPSPFDVLEGTIEASVETTLWQSAKGLVIPIEIATNLYTQVQKVKTAGKITMYIPEGFKKMDVVTDINIDDFVIELPPLDPVQGFPQLTQDSRVLIKEPEAKADPNGFKVGLIYSFRTTKPGAVRLLSKMAKPAIPISLDLDRTAKGDVLGTVKVEAFELTYFHRTMLVDLLRVILDDRESADFAVDGRLRMEQTQYKIFIAISGTLQSPLIKLSSEPELPRSDIISVLLYDRTSDQLVAADRETVGTFETAISDRAIGLLGLWIFASTPIRSFSYNPVSKVYTATVQLAEGTTASVGTDWEQAAQLEVKKRVTRRWVLTASWAPSDENQSGKLVLQWEKRF